MRAKKQINVTMVMAKSSDDSISQVELDSMSVTRLNNVTGPINCHTEMQLVICQKALARVCESQEGIKMGKRDEIEK